MLKMMYPCTSQRVIFGGKVVEQWLEKNDSCAAGGLQSRSRTAICWRMDTGWCQYERD